MIEMIKKRVGTIIHTSGTTKSFLELPKGEKRRKILSGFFENEEERRSSMHDNALKQPRATETSLTESTPSLSLEQQIVSLLEHVLQEEPAASRQLDLPAKRPRG